MKAMIKDLLTYSQVGRKDGTVESTDCHAVVEAVLANLQQVIQERDAKMVFDGLPTVQADKGQLTHVFQNLLSNALKFCESKPLRVHIRANRRNKEWVFAVQDNGIGIASEYHERIFTIFQRLRTREEYPGTGIGLAVCKKVVERHHGRMWLESQPKEGTTFYFTLPQEQPSSNPKLRLACQSRTKIADVECLTNSGRSDCNVHTATVLALAHGFTSETRLNPYKFEKTMPNSRSRHSCLLFVGKPSAYRTANLT